MGRDWEFCKCANEDGELGECPLASGEVFSCAQCPYAYDFDNEE